MAKPLLVVGTKYKSSWSLRPWIAMKAAGVDFEERVLMLDTKEFKTAMKQYTPPSSGRVPVLVDGDITVWESLAICEYVADNFAPQLWPKDKAARALARSVSNEMHAGFAALRNACSMNLKGDFRGSTLSPEAGADAHRVLTIWRMCREKYGASGPWLFGNQFTIADAMYAPVVTRFVTYGIPADAVGQAYIDAMQAHPAFQEWKKAALAEP